MNVSDLRAALEDIPDEAIVLHATIRHEGETIILTDADYEEDESEDDAAAIDWPEEPT